jgi:hypothetical protein
MRTPPFALLPLLLLAAALPAPAGAHPLDLGVLEIVLEGDRLEQTLRLSAVALVDLVELDADGDGAIDERDIEARREQLFAATLGRSAPRTDGGDCALQPTAARLEGLAVRLEASGRCPPGGRLRQRLAMLDQLPDAHRILVEARIGGERARRIAERATPMIAFEGGAQAGGGFGAFVWLGVEHIFAGWDHLLFLLALVLGGGSLKRLLGIVTAFTLAHSITLGLAALSVVSLPGRLVESAIAASIIYVAVENLVGAQGGRRWAVAFLFGLIHGFGFASALSEIHVSPGGLVGALLGFNLGVELGQAALVLPIAPLVGLARRRPQFVRLGVPALSLATLAAGAYWFVGRAFAG